MGIQRCTVCEAYIKIYHMTELEKLKEGIRTILIFKVNLYQHKTIIESLDTAYTLGQSEARLKALGEVWEVIAEIESGISPRVANIIHVAINKLKGEI
jgi:hypothetical protein